MTLQDIKNCLFYIFPNDISIFLVKKKDSYRSGPMPYEGAFDKEQLPPPS